MHAPSVVSNLTLQAHCTVRGCTDPKFSDLRMQTIANRWLSGVQSSLPKCQIERSQVNLGHTTLSIIWTIDCRDCVATRLKTHPANTLILALQPPLADTKRLWVCGSSSVTFLCRESDQLPSTVRETTLGKTHLSLPATARHCEPKVWNAVLTVSPLPESITRGS